MASWVIRYKGLLDELGAIRPSSGSLDEFDRYIGSIFFVDQVFQGGHDTPIVQYWRANTIDQSAPLGDGLTQDAHHLIDLLPRRLGFDLRPRGLGLRIRAPAAYCTNPS